MAESTSIYIRTAWCCYHDDQPQGPHPDSHSYSRSLQWMTIYKLVNVNRQDEYCQGHSVLFDCHGVSLSIFSLPIRHPVHLNILQAGAYTSLSVNQGEATKDEDPIANFEVNLKTLLSLNLLTWLLIMQLNRILFKEMISFIHILLLLLE